jgi:hypothetical protein
MGRLPLFEQPEADPLAPKIITAILFTLVLTATFRFTPLLDVLNRFYSFIMHVPDELLKAITEAFKIDNWKFMLVFLLLALYVYLRYVRYCPRSCGSLPDPPQPEPATIRLEVVAIPPLRLSQTMEASGQAQQYQAQAEPPPSPNPKEPLLPGGPATPTR